MIHIHDPIEEAKPLAQRPVLFDGCAECDQRASDPLSGLCRLDSEHVTAMWGRMKSVEYGIDIGGYGDRYLSLNEKKVGHALYLMSILLQRHPTLLRGV